MSRAKSAEDAEKVPIDRLSEVVIDHAISIHRQLGPGLLESVYERVLAASLAREGWRVATQIGVPIEYDGLVFDVAFRIDLLVDDRLVVEIKSVEELKRVHAKQPVGLLLNFSANTMREGIRRLVNEHRDRA